MNKYIDKYINDRYMTSNTGIAERCGTVWEGPSKMLLLFTYKECEFTLIPDHWPLIPNTSVGSVGHLRKVFPITSCDFCHIPIRSDR